ncbi:hypothetical protein NQZ68_018695 [Dissostichus eleginoides]|nr:hypothetical protein NQZ68_018695 [Dissostichus eleginoides]
MIVGTKTDPYRGGRAGLAAVSQGPSSIADKHPVHIAVSCLAQLTAVGDMQAAARAEQSGLTAGVSGPLFDFERAGLFGERNELGAAKRSPIHLSHV